MASMVSTNAGQADMSMLKEAIEEWFHALTGAFVHGGGCRPTAHNQIRQDRPTKSHTAAMLEPFMGCLLAAGGMASITLYLAQSVDWPGTGMHFLLKVVSWL